MYTHICIYILFGVSLYFLSLSVTKTPSELEAQLAISLRPAFLGRSLLVWVLAVMTPACSLYAPGYSPANTHTNLPAREMRQKKQSSPLNALCTRQRKRILASYGRYYENKRIENFVNHILIRLAHAAHKYHPHGPQRRYHVRLLNSPHINAFALPNGEVYMTRGLLALAQDSSEVAAVLAHEMAHILAQHSLLRQKEMTQIVQDSLPSPAQQSLKRASSSLFFMARSKLAQFSRQQEMEADRLGTFMLADAGYDPFAMARFLQSMEAYAQLLQKSISLDKKLDFLAFHPSTPQRIAQSFALAQRLGAKNPAIYKETPASHAAFLKIIEGLLYSDVTSEGYLRNGRFIDKKLHIAFPLPPMFSIHHAQNAFLASGPSKSAIRFDKVLLESSTSAKNYLESGWVKNLNPESIQTTTICGFPAAYGQALQESWSFVAWVIKKGPYALRFIFAQPKDVGNAYELARQVVGGFQRLTSKDLAQLKPLKIRLYKARQKDTPKHLIALMQGTQYPEKLFYILNGIHENTTLTPGAFFKIIGP